ncbi:MAG: hypothetical protein LBR33_01255 [Propionibacteriaceae bacterium]|jgi:virulence-associated protein VagC|nr:hypothetical protein [Propionibacteriaceae bacterium]
MTDPTPTPAPAPNPGLPRLARIVLPAVALVTGASLLVTLAQDAAVHGHTWTGVLGDQWVVITDYQPLGDARDIVYPADYPVDLQLVRLPVTVQLKAVESISVYRREDVIIAYSIRAVVEPVDGVEAVIRQAMENPAYSLDFSWNEQPGEFSLRWNLPE